jgi:hypothetical protein
LAHSFEGFSLRLLGPIACRSLVRQNIIVTVYDRSIRFIARAQKRERKLAVVPMSPSRAHPL